jgi:FkbM family methyltransferase
VTPLLAERRDLLLAVLPHDLVEGVRSRRMLLRLGAATTGRGAAQRAREARLDLPPPHGLAHLETVVDVGASDGRWSAAVAALARPRRLIAVEPSPDVLPRLHAAIGGIDGVTIVEAAVGGASGEMTLYLTSHSHNTSLARPRSDEMDELYGGGYAVRGRVRVNVMPLDEITRDLHELSLLKIDAQGSERLVLDGAPETLRKTGWLLVEANFRSHYEGDMLYPELHARLADCGFDLTGLSPSHVRQGVALWCDSLYTRHRDRRGSGS